MALVQLTKDSHKYLGGKLVLILVLPWPHHFTQLCYRLSLLQAVSARASVTGFFSVTGFWHVLDICPTRRHIFPRGHVRKAVLQIANSN